MTGEMTVWMSTLRLVPRSFRGIGNMPHVVASSTLSPSHFLPSGDASKTDASKPVRLPLEFLRDWLDRPEGAISSWRDQKPNHGRSLLQETWSHCARGESMINSRNI